MSGKRQATYTIDPNTLEEREKDHDAPADQQTNGNATSKAQRKIFKIKRPGQVDPEDQKESKVQFKLNESQQIKPSQENTNGGVSKDEAKKEEPVNPFANLFKADKNIFNGIGIFSSLNSTNLFTSNQGTQQTSQAKANPIGASGIFAASGTNLFNNSTTTVKNTSASLFTTNPPAPVDDEGSGDSAQLQQTQKIESDPTKSVAHFSYEETCPVVLSLKVAKFKKAGSDLIENVEIVLQKQKETNIKYITVRLPATKKSIFSGVLVEGRSQVKHLHGKKQNVEVSAFTKEKSGFTKAILKFQFKEDSEGEKLFERLEELLATKQDSSVAQTPKQEKA